MLAIIGNVFTVAMIVLGSILLYQRFVIGHKRPAKRRTPQVAHVHGDYGHAQPRQRVRRRTRQPDLIGDIAGLIGAFVASLITARRTIQQRIAEARHPVASVKLSPIVAEIPPHMSVETGNETRNEAETAPETPLFDEHAIEQIEIATIARLVKAKATTETKALEATFEVKAGSSPEYRRVRDLLKAAIAELERDAEAAPVAAFAQSTDAPEVRRASAA